MEQYVQFFLPVLLAIFASTGFWSYLTVRMQKKTAMSRMVLGLGHTRLLKLGEEYICRGWITTEEYQDYMEYLYAPYKEMGGNGTVERIVSEVAKLPVRKGTC